jgi:tripartite ATP-independent transporter DctM subunit
VSTAPTLPASENAVTTRRRWPIDSVVAGGALVLMLLIPLVEMAARPLLGHGISNAPVLVQHLGLVLAMFGAVAAERTGHLTTLAGNAPTTGWRGGLAAGSAALLCGVLAHASAQLVWSERSAGHGLAYGIPVWAFQAVLPVGFAWLGMRLGRRAGAAGGQRTLAVAAAVVLPLAGAAMAVGLDGDLPLPLPLVIAWLVLALLGGAPIFTVLGGLALALFAHEGQPLASVPLSHYQITVNPSLPALPLFTLAGLILARTGAAGRLGQVFVALFGPGVRGTVIAAAVMCSGFTAVTGGSGVTILALGGLLLPLLNQTGYPERQGIGLVTSASALGVLLAPSVPLILYAIIARVPINTMFLAGVVPAVVMVVCLLVFGGFLRAGSGKTGTTDTPPPDTGPRPALGVALWQARWELLAPVVAIGSLVSGLATPTESAALTAAYALLTQAVAHRELTARGLGAALALSVQVIGGVMLILGMALGLTNYLIDAGIPDAATEWVQQVLPNRYLFLLVLSLFLLLAGALMEIFAALVVLVPLLLPVAQSYGIDPVHFGVIFLAAMEMGFLCPPAGMNLYFASAMFERPMREVARAVVPAVLAILLGTLLLSAIPALSLALPQWWAGR